MYYIYRIGSTRAKPVSLLSVQESTHAPFQHFFISGHAGIIYVEKFVFRCGVYDGCIRLLMRIGKLGNRPRCVPYYSADNSIPKMVSYSTIQLRYMATTKLLPSSLLLG